MKLPLIGIDHPTMPRLNLGKEMIVPFLHNCCCIGRKRRRIGRLVYIKTSMHKKCVKISERLEGQVGSEAVVLVVLRGSILPMDGLL